MPIELSSLDFDALVALVRQVATSRQPQTIVTDSGALVRLVAERPAPAGADVLSVALPVTETDSLFEIVGLAGETELPDDLATEKHRYVADAFDPRR